MDMTREEMIQKLKDAELYEDGMADNELKDLVYALSDSIETAEHEETFRELQLKYDPEDALDDDWMDDRPSPLNIPSCTSTPNNKTSATITKHASIEDIFNSSDNSENILPESDTKLMLNGLNESDTSFSSDEKESSSPTIKVNNKRKLVQKNVLNNKDMLDISSVVTDGSKKIKIDTLKNTRTYEKKNKTLDSDGHKSDYETENTPTRKKYQTRSQQMVLLATTPKENKAQSSNSKLMTRLKEIEIESIINKKTEQNLTISSVNSNKVINKDLNLNLIKNSNDLASKKLRSGSTIRRSSKFVTSDKEIEELLENSSSNHEEELSYNRTLSTSELFDEVKSGGKMWMDKFPLQPFVNEKSSMSRSTFEPLPSTSTTNNHIISLRDSKRKREESPDTILPAREVKVSVHSPPQSTGKDKQVIKQRRRNSGEWEYKNVEIEYDKILTEEEYRNEIRSAYASTSSAKATSTCPICQKDFSRSFIESHASTCGEK